MEIMENEEQILKKYKLSDEEHEQYYQTIKRIYIGGKTPVKMATRSIEISIQGPVFQTMRNI